jgi:transposase
LALDITSISSYSQLISEVEWGYNRDKEKLPQINLCLLVGEKTRLPVFQTVYSGSIGDVSTLKTTLRLAASESIALDKISLVMDKGFYSAGNIDALISIRNGFKFLISVPFSSKFAKARVEEAKCKIDQVSNAIRLDEDDTVLGLTQEGRWKTKYKIYIHIYYNAVSAAQAKMDLYSEVLDLAELAKKDPDNEKYSKKFKKFLTIARSSETDAPASAEINQEAVEAALAYSGWLIIISSHVPNAIDAIRIYRAKDVVEKAFCRFKNSMDFGRTRVHSSQNLHNKVFVGFIALILMSFIHKVMIENDLYLSMTMKRLIHTLGKLHVQYISNERILYPLTKEQKKIFEAFRLTEPL